MAHLSDAAVVTAEMQLPVPPDRAAEVVWALTQLLRARSADVEVSRDGLGIVARRPLFELGPSPWWPGRDGFTPRISDLRYRFRAAGPWVVAETRVVFARELLVACAVPLAVGLAALIVPPVALLAPVLLLASFAQLALRAHRAREHACALLQHAVTSVVGRQPAA